MTEETNAVTMPPAGGDVDALLLDQMVKAGVAYGRKKTKTHPRMQRYIFGTRNGIEIMDVSQTVGLLEEAAKFLADIVKRKGILLFVGTTPAAREVVRALAERLGAPFVIQRWLGGTLTNYKTLSQRLQYFMKLRVDRDAGKLAKYTKKERLDFDKEIERMAKLFGGLEKLTALPEAVVIVDASSHTTAIREARALRIPIVAVMGSDADPDIIDHPIPANDRARASVTWVLDRLEKEVAEFAK